MGWSITEDSIKCLIAETQEKVWEPFPGITIVAWNLPNGYTISEQSGCINPNDYNRELGVTICRDRLENKVWELEGYLRKQQYNEEVE